MMEQIVKNNVSLLGGLSFKCQCGQRHDFAQTNVLICPDAHLLALRDVSMYGQKALIIGDEKAFASATASALRKKIICVNYKLQPQKDKQNFADCFQLLKENEDIRLIAAIGGHAANETAKLVAAKINLPLISFVTKLDSDFFCCTSSLLKLSDRHSLSPAVAPAVLAVDTNFIENSREALTDALGLIAKSAVVLFDKLAAAAVTGQPFCKLIYGVLLDSLKKCLLLNAEDKTTIPVIAETLIKISFMRDACHERLLTNVDGLMLTLCGEYACSRAAAASSLLVSVYSELLQETRLTLPVNGLKLMELANTSLKSGVAISYEPQNSLRIESSKKELLSELEKTKALMKLISADYDKPLETNVQYLKAKVWVSAAIYPFSGLLRAKLLSSGSALADV